MKQNKHNTKLSSKIIFMMILISIFILIVPRLSTFKLDNYNSITKLNIVSSYGDNEAYHPKVLNFENEWHGYKYWMAFTPYPGADDSRENPHIVASNNLVEWKTPEGLINPLDEVKDSVKYKKYNSDTHLVYNENLDRIECYWRYVNDLENQVIIYRRCSSDGVNFSDKEIFIKSDNRKEKDYVSPAIVYENQTYKMWYVDKRKVQYKESKDGVNWSNDYIVEVNYEDPRLDTWHLDVISTEKGYEMVTVAYRGNEKRKNMNVYYAYSNNEKQNWSQAIKILEPTTGTKYWDNQGLYRSCLVYEDGVYILFYSGFNTKSEHGIGIVYGKDITKLNSVNVDFFKYKNSEKMLELVEN